MSFSPDGEFLVTAMQENALHGWRLRDECNMAMPGYPSKIKSFAWVGGTPHLATSGADEAICWPFDGKSGPLGRKPVCVAYGGEQMATCVQALPGEEAVFVGFRDGTVLMAELDEAKDAFVLRGSTDAEVTAIAVAPSRSHVLVGDAGGHVLWAPLWAGAGDAYAGMFDRTRPDAEAVRRVKALVAAHLGLPETITVTVAELRCHEPNCPPIETVITARETNGHAKDWRNSETDQRNHRRGCSAP